MSNGRPPCAGSDGCGCNGTLIDLLERRAGDPAGHYTFLPDRDVIDRRVPADELSFPDLARQAREIAAHLQQRTTPGRRALLLYPAGPGFLPAFFGCLYAGVVGIPAPPPERARLRHSLPRLKAILEDAKPDLILTTDALRGALAEHLDELLPGRRWLATDMPSSMSDATSPRWQPPDIDAESLAYLQYTSGSTAAPRGVMLTHGNLLHNLGHLQRGFGYDAASRSVTWMPHFHDYGLVDGLLQPLYSNIPCHVLSPISILKRPLRWLQAMDQHGASHTHGPNFAYELCRQRITPEQRATLDLTRWRVAGNGAEPIRASTLEGFAEYFSPCGFRAETFYPAYGMAETTLFVTARPHGRPVRTCRLLPAAIEQHRVAPAPLDSPAARTVVSCGAPQPGTDLRIVDPATQRSCAAEAIGEVWVADRSVALGYWRRPEDTVATFGARLADDPEAGPFLRTGDLGFLQAGELYVTGRLKDLIIVAGVNHYPQAIEWTIQTHCPELRRDHCVALGVERDGEERLVVLAEPERGMADWRALFRRIRRLIAEQHGVSVAAIAMVARGGILKTSSGKLRRLACRDEFVAGRLDLLAAWDARAAEVPAVAIPETGRDTGRPIDTSELRAWLCARMAELMEIKPQGVAADIPFAEYGLDSRRAIAFVAEIESRLDIGELDPTIVWRYPTAASLAAHLTAGPMAVPVAAPSSRHAADEPIAIVGMACRFPGAPDIAGFWSLLRDGRSAIGPSPTLPGVEGGFLQDVEAFDAAFFSISANEARSMDPQQRLTLEVAWEALEDACLAPAQVAGRRVGVWIGVSSADHGYRQAARPDAADLVNAHTGPGLAFCMTANRLSYLLDLRGPSMAVDTACSSSLAAVHQACQSLRSGESELALAGGANLILSPQVHMALQRAGMLSPSQRCRTFDADADGYVRGEGCGVVVLQPLADAQRAGLPILAVIRGSAVNQDGRSNGLTAPNPLAQQAVIRDALAAAGLAPRDIGYVETHGTGTRLGDPIEVGALQAVLEEGRSAGQPCSFGSVKTNIGHLEAAAGIAGLIKAVLSLRHRAIPPHLNVRSLNRLIRLDGSAFRLANHLAAWPPGEAPRRAGVSSFGFGGSNAHVVVEEAPQISAPDTQASFPTQVFAVSARTPAALRTLASRHAAAIAGQSASALPDLCFSVATGRMHHPERLAVPASSSSALAARLLAFADRGEAVGVASGRAAAAPPHVVFLFSGQGAQYARMGHRLYATHKLFRSVLDECAEVLRDCLDRPLLEVLFGDDPTLIDRTTYTQPALFALEYALARLWMDWGVRPAAVLGHSVGEYVAACVAGVLDLQDGLRLVAARGRLIGELPEGGAMLAVNADEAFVADAVAGLQDRVSIAAVNAPDSTVLAGGRPVLDALAARFATKAIGCRFLPVSHAFHSPLLDPILDRFHALAAGFTYAPPRLPWIANLDGKPHGEAPDADYWTRHLREPVRFAAGIRHLDAAFKGATGCVFLEIGPKAVLAGLGARTAPDPRHRWLASLHPGRDDASSLADSLGWLYVAGADLDWARVFPDAPRRLDGLPTYPFERVLHAMPPPPALRADGPVSGTPATTVTMLIERGDAEALARHLVEAGTVAAQQRDGLVTGLQALIDQHRREAAAAPKPSRLFHELRWEAAPWRRPVGPRMRVRWLIVADAGDLGERLARALERSGDDVVIARGAAALPPDGPGFDGPGFEGIVCLGALDAPPPDGRSVEALMASQEFGVGAVLGLLQHLARRTRPTGAKLWVVTQGATWTEPSAMQPGSKPRSQLDQATLWGLGRVIRLEHPDLWGGLIDLDPDLDAADQAGALAGELLDNRTEDQVALRAGRGLVPRLAAMAPLAGSLTIPPDGTILITGGLGALGLRVAEWLVQRGARSIVLAGRGAPTQATRQRITALEAMSARIVTARVDVALELELAGLLGRIREDMAPLRGVIHAAGVNDDGILLLQDSQRMSAVLQPKLAGAWNLHRLTSEAELAFFVMFSSASSLLGWRGQGSYAAANAFLDSLAHARRREGRPALSVNWGPWAAIGAAAGIRDRHRGTWAAQGVRSLDPDEAIAALELAMTQASPQLAILPIDWRHFARPPAPHAAWPMLAGLIGDAASDAGNHDAREREAEPRVARMPLLAGRLRSAAPSERRKLLVSHIRAEAAEILGREIKFPPDPSQGLFDLGFDSLMALELRNRLEAAIDRPLAATLAFDHPSIAGIALHLLDLLGLAEAKPAGPLLGAQPAAIDDALAALDIRQLSESELEALVDRELQRSLS